ncbi:hypothetical protein ACTFQF_17655 [Aliivibrio fischeri]|uniref:hypothetical protein n=1 Tax=Aliivibrio fischeri TaxID=668 RepID=UPI0007C55C14|nr:hypothetical protein [Aliivibrio fischeri]MBP3139230.1 hypothetical protein [Aliivibrio fischeri]MBP3154820.1 hypothetical protein [Aliivibrio fischeri]MCE7574522.1 hypothetical protein [Aliivibrio fischeri]
MNNSEFCNIKSYKLSPSSKRSMNELSNVIDIGNYAATFTAAMPIVRIFTDRNATNTIHNISQHDWIEFANAMNSIKDVVRTRGYNIADEAALFGSTQDKEFWRCMKNALR